MTDVLTARERLRGTLWRTSCEDIDRGKTATWRQRQSSELCCHKPRDSWGFQKQEARKDPPLEASHLDFQLLVSRIVRQEIPVFVGLWYLTCGCSRKLMASQVAQWKRICLQCKRQGFDPWVRKILWRRKWQPTPVLLPGKPHGWKSLVGYSPWVAKSWTRLSDFTSPLYPLVSFKKTKDLDITKLVPRLWIGKEKKKKNWINFKEIFYR